MKKARFVAGAIALAGLMALAGSLPPCARAADDEVTRLQDRVVELEEKVRQLEALLKLHSEEDAHRDESALPAAYGWENTKNWRGLKRGMTEEQVRKALGEPIKVISGVRTLWYYPNIYCGYVSFDKDGQLNGWSEP